MDGQRNRTGGPAGRGNKAQHSDPQTERQIRQAEKGIWGCLYNQPQPKRKLHQPETGGIGSVTIVTVVTIPAGAVAVFQIPSQSSQPSHAPHQKEDDPHEKQILS